MHMLVRLECCRLCPSFSLTFWVVNLLASVLSNQRMGLDYCRLAFGRKLLLLVLWDLGDIRILLFRIELRSLMVELSLDDC